MQKNMFRKALVFGIIALFVGACVIPLPAREPENNCMSASYNSFPKESGTEYWALIFAVGIYYKNPEEDKPFMLKSAIDLYEVLLDSPNWEEDHIHKITAEKATGRRLIRELIWLIRSADSDDMSLIYLTTHGGPLKGQGGNPIDLPPRDEDDGADEILIMYEGFDKWYAFIWDDLLNFFLSLLQSKGVCLIVDSCHSGGFNDNPMFNEPITKDYTAESFTQGLSEELSTQNRIVLMSCEENETSKRSYFSECLIDGFWGWADSQGNRDGINSAEEAFDYAKVLVNERYDFNPTILDLYPGEFPVTYT